MRFVNDYRRVLISIHAPLAGCDAGCVHMPMLNPNFNPRTPCGVRPTISIIASVAADFNPRTPCGVRHDTKDADTDEYQFQSTHPLRGATCPRRARREGNPISIHAPLAGCDPLSPERFAYSVYFNPRTPCGVRRLTAGRQWDSHNFNPRTPCGVRLCPGCNQKMRCIFQSTHPLRGATSFLGSIPG